MKLKAFFFEILPITTFFIIAQYQSIIIAALLSSLFSLIVLITFYFIEKRIAKFQIFSIILSGYIMKKFLLRLNHLYIMAYFLQFYWVVYSTKNQ
jgi:intracellular septation protein A